MKKFSLARLLIFAAMAATTLAWFVSRNETLRLKANIDELNETVDTLDFMVNRRDEQLAAARMGTSLLYRLAQSGNFPELFAFLDRIPPESLSCNIMELKEFPTIRLVSYYQNRNCEDGSWLPDHRCKSAAIIVRSDTLEVIDYLVHERAGSVSKFMNDPYVINWEHSDGTTVEHKILPSGFERIQ